MARRRRGRKWLVLSAALLLWLGVRESAGPAPVTGGSAPRAAVTAELVTSIPTSPGRESAVPLEPNGARAALRDRFEGFLRAMGSNDFGAAMRAAKAAGQLDLRDDERAELERVRGVLDLRLEGEIAACLALARGGEVLAAVTRLRAIEQIEPGLVAAALPGGKLPADAGTDPGSPDFPRGLRVRFLDDEGVLRDAEVAQAQGALEITLRVRDQGGYRYPTVPLVRVEPCSDSADQARAQRKLAAGHGDPLLAALWALRESSAAR